MKLLSKIARNFFWTPTDFIPSLESLDASHGVLAKTDVTEAVGGIKEQYALPIVELWDGKVIGDLRMVATAKDTVIGKLQALFNLKDPLNHYLMQRRRFRMLKYRKGTALLLGSANSDNYYHWMLDSVPRWKMLQAANWSEYDYVLLHSRSVRFQEEMLDRLGIPEAKRLRCSKNFVHQFERLVVPAMPSFPPEDVPQWICAYVRSLFPEKAAGPEKIYLRRGGGRRRLANEAELEKALEARGFVSIQTEKLTVAEQARILSSARCVVGPHGAALTNLFFAPPGAMLLELFHPQHKNHCYINIAAACGQRYASLDGHSANQAGDRQLEYTIDIPAVLKLISEKN